MEGLDKEGQGPTSGCCAIEEEEAVSHLIHIFLSSVVTVGL
jgi:hypothetical protein